jgi:hypothetical protein
MVAITSESLILLTEAARKFPTQPHVATMRRWVREGVRGVKLEAVFIGGASYTSIEAMNRFVEALNHESETVSA